MLPRISVPTPVASLTCDWTGSPDVDFNCVGSTDYLCPFSLLGQSVGLCGLLCTSLLCFLKPQAIVLHVANTWVCVRCVKLSKDPIASGSVYIMNLMGQVPMSQLVIHGQVLVSCRLGRKLDKQVPHSGSLHLELGCRRSLSEGPQSHFQFTRKDYLKLTFEVRS